MEDSKIIDQLFDRTESALTEVQNKYGRLCYKLAYNILGNASDTEECVNDAYLGLWNSIPPNRPESLRAYLCRIVRNLSLKKYQYNSAAKRNSSMDVALEELEGCLNSSMDVEKQIVEKELSGEIEKFMSQLKQTDRVIFMRRYYFMDSYADIAAATGMTEKNVSVKLTRIRKKLRDYLVQQNYLN